MRLLVTGAAGGVGTLLRPRLAAPGRVLRLFDTTPVEPGSDSTEETRTGSVTDPAALREACTGVDAILHLAGFSGEAAWEDILDVNVNGTRCLLEAARQAGITRVLLASSNHAVGFASRADAGADGLPADLAPRPDTYYGWSKAAIEALGSLYADRFGLDVICLRIGSCFGHPGNARGLGSWLSPDDAARLVEASLAVPAPGFRIVWGISANTRAWWSPDAGADIGFRPVDDAERHADEIDGAEEAAAPDERVGGPFCTVPLGTVIAR